MTFNIDIQIGLCNRCFGFSKETLCSWFVVTSDS